MVIPIDHIALYFKVGLFLLAKEKRASPVS